MNDLGDIKPRNWADREYTPAEAAYAIAQYTSFNAAFFLQQCDLAGLDVYTDGRLINMYAADGIDDRKAFLMAWLKLDRSKRTMKAVRTSLKRRGRMEAFQGNLRTTNADPS